MAKETIFAQLPQTKRLPIRLLIAEDSELAVGGFRSVLSVPPFEILEVFHSRQPVRRSAFLGQAHILLLDLEMPESMDNDYRDIDTLFLDQHRQNTSGTFLLMEKLLAQAPALKIVVISNHTEPALMAHAKETGASGYLPKSLPSLLERLPILLQRVHRGERIFPPQLQEEMLITNLTRSQFRSLLAWHDYSHLSMTERASLLGIAPSTHKIHLHEACERLGARSSHEAILRLQQLGSL